MAGYKGFLPALEQNIIANPDDLELSKCPWVSAGAATEMARATVSGILYSVSCHLATSGLSRQTFSAKITELINLLKKNGDIDDSTYKCLIECDLYTQRATINMNRSLAIDVPLYSYYRELQQHSMWGCEDAHYYEKDQSKFSDEEKALIAARDEARRAAYEAERKCDIHFRLKACCIINDYLVKYSEILNRIDAPWYKEMCECNKRETEWAKNFRKNAKEEEADSAVEG